MHARALHLDDEIRELATLTRAHRGVVSQFRMESLASRIAHDGPLPIVSQRCGFAGDRWALVLDDGTQLRCRLYWPDRTPVCRLCAIGWQAGEGWRLWVRATSGRTVVLRAFRTDVVAPPPQAHVG